MNNSETERETKALEKLAAAYSIEGEGVFAEGRLEKILGAGNADLAKALRANEKQTRELVSQMSTANKLLLESNKTSIRNNYKDRLDEIKDADIKEAVVALSAFE